MKYSTGRGTRVRHSTAMEWSEYEKKKKRRSRFKYSTGKDSSIAHSCGVLFDGEIEEQDEAASQSRSDPAEEKKPKKSFKTITADY